VGNGCGTGLLWMSCLTRPAVRGGGEDGSDGLEGLWLHVGFRLAPLCVVRRGLLEVVFGRGR